MAEKIINGSIYTIRSHQTDKIYIGSTTQKLSKRMVNHRMMYKSFTKGKCNYMTSFEIIKYNDAYIELISEHQNITKNELHKQEGYAIRNANNCVNICIAGRSKKEYDDENREKKKEYDRDNYEKIKIRKRKYIEDNKEMINQSLKNYYVNNKSTIQAKQKVYYENNKDKYIEYQSKNAERINKVRNAIIFCEDCECYIKRKNLSGHKQTTKHISNSK